MLELVPAKGDARSERQSSGLRSLTRATWAKSRGYPRIVLAGFVLIHSLIQAYRAGSAGALPEPGLESEPLVVALVLLGVWLPTLVFAAREFFEPLRIESSIEVTPPGLRAVRRIEPAALSILLVFGSLHAAQLAWPVLNGRLLPSDVRPELIAILSSTRSGVPLQAIALLATVAAASFYAVRQLQKAFPDARSGSARGLVALGIISYLLGSYAVIRCASGSLFSW
jgi:hypothetical protein